MECTKKCTIKSGAKHTNKKAIWTVRSGASLYWKDWTTVRVKLGDRLEFFLALVLKRMIVCLIKTSSVVFFYKLKQNLETIKSQLILVKHVTRKCKTNLYVLEFFHDVGYLADATYIRSTKQSKQSKVNPNSSNQALVRFEPAPIGLLVLYSNH